MPKQIPPVFDNQSRTLALVIPDGDSNFGILDGGHTLLSIEEALSRPLPADGERGDQYIRLEVIEGIEEILPRVASARNFSEDVSLVSLANYEERLNWLKDAVRPFVGHVRWFQNDDGKVDATDLIQILTAVNPHEFGRYKHPVEAYRNAGKCLEYAVDPQDQHHYTWLAPVALDIWRLYDTIRFNWWDLYRLPDPVTGRAGRPRATMEGSQRKRVKAKLMEYVTLGKSGDPEKDVHVEKGLAIPLLSGFRALLRQRSDEQGYEWSSDPFEFFERHGQALVRKVMEASDQRGNNPNTVGRDPTVYDTMYEAIELRLLREDA